MARRRDWMGLLRLGTSVGSARLDRARNVEWCGVIWSGLACRLGGVRAGQVLAGFVESVRQGLAGLESYWPGLSFGIDSSARLGQA